MGWKDSGGEATLLVTGGEVRGTDERRRGGRQERRPSMESLPSHQQSRAPATSTTSPCRPRDSSDHTTGHEGRVVWNPPWPAQSSFLRPPPLLELKGSV